MRKQNTKTTVPLDVEPERRTKRFPARYRPVGRFCELRFRYLSSPTSREGGISRPLDHIFFFEKKKLYLQIKMRYLQLSVTLISRNLRIRSKQLATVIPKGPNNKVHDQRIFSEDNPWS